MKNPYDRGFKILAEDHPELLLKLLGLADSGTKTQITSILRELQFDAVQIDHAYIIGAADIFHFEAITKWHAERLGRLGLYTFLLSHRYDLPVYSYVVLMAEKYAPKSLPARLTYRGKNGLVVKTPYKVIRLWQIDPAIAFEPGNEPLLPWVPLLKGGKAEFERAALAIESLPPPHEPEVLMNDLASLAALRYDRVVIQELARSLRNRTMFSIDAFKVSWLFKEGLAEGKAEGLLEGKRSTLRVFAGKKFPATQFPEIDQIHEPEICDNLLLAAMEAATEEQFRARILAALRPN